MKQPGYYIIPAGALLCFLPVVGAGAALLLGVLIALIFGNPYAGRTEKLSTKMLALCIVGLGAGMNLEAVAQAGMSGLFYTAISIALVLALGLLLGWLLRTQRDCSLLIAAGTAICGGSAIAALAPVIRARPHSITAALALVFVLNALALFLFPWAGKMLELSEQDFGLWSALAIHDTSSVVGAGMQYGPEALEVGTTVKLARALWIIPLVFAVQFFYRHETDAASMADGKPAKHKYPWFILGFLAMAALFTWTAPLAPAGEMITFAAQRGMVVTLFLVGANVSAASIKEAGFMPALQASALWAVTATLSLLAILGGWIILPS